MTDAAANPRVRVEPTATEATAPFWEASRRKQLTLQWCRLCEEPIFYPREACPKCLGSDLDWRPAVGRGVVYAISVQHKPAYPTLAERVPYVVALVDLDEGVRMMTNIVGCDVDDVAIGQAVEVTWEALSDGRHLPQFQPIQEA